MRVLDDLLGPQDVFNALSNLGCSRPEVAACALSRTTFYVGKVNNIDILTDSLIKILAQDFDAEY